MAVPGAFLTICAFRTWVTFQSGHMGDTFRYLRRARKCRGGSVAEGLLVQCTPRAALLSLPSLRCAAVFVTQFIEARSSEESCDR